jgi:hypothetical protein
MREKRRSQFLKDVAAAVRQALPKPRGKPSPQNMTEEGRALGLEAIRNAPRCRAKRRDGEPCRAAAMRGSTRCLKHGGRVEVPAHPHNVRRLLSGTMDTTEGGRDEYRRSREAWDRMNLREQREFIAMLPPEIAKKRNLVIYAANTWPQVEGDGYRSWARLLQDPRARMMAPE